MSFFCPWKLLSIQSKGVWKEESSLVFVLRGVFSLEEKSGLTRWIIHLNLTGLIIIEYFSSTLLEKLRHIGSESKEVISESASMWYVQLLTYCQHYLGCYFLYVHIMRHLFLCHSLNLSLSHSWLNDLITYLFT